MINRDDVVSVGEVAHILSIIAAPPNKRSTPLPGDRRDLHFQDWFDGGGITYVTGGATRFVFGDGLEVDVWGMFSLTVAIRWPDGRIVQVNQEMPRPA